MSDTVFYVRDAKTGKHLPFKAVDLGVQGFEVDAILLLFMNLSEETIWQIQ